MKVAYISHSLVAERQQLFAEALGAQLGPGKLRTIAPTRWGKHTYGLGWEVENEGDMANYRLPQAAWDTLKEWGPDIVLLQQEAYCQVAKQTLDWCLGWGVPYVTFGWENAASPKAVKDHPWWEDVLAWASVNVFGNSAARAIATRAGIGTRSCVLPQVGIDHGIFTPKTVPKEYDILFTGRKDDPMKGEEVLDAATAGSSWKVAKGYELGFVSYDQLPERYSRAVVQAVPSRDVPGRPREQFAPAVTIEGLMCGVPVVTTQQQAIYEWLEGGRKSGCPAAWTCLENDAVAFASGIAAAMRTYKEEPDVWHAMCEAGRRWAVERFSNDVVAAKYIKVFKQVME